MPCQAHGRTHRHRSRHVWTSERPLLVEPLFLQEVMQHVRIESCFECGDQEITGGQLFAAAWRRGLLEVETMGQMESTQAGMNGGKNGLMVVQRGNPTGCWSVDLESVGVISLEERIFFRFEIMWRADFAAL